MLRREILNVLSLAKGSAASGNYGHGGRIGEVGGSTSRATVALLSYANKFGGATVDLRIGAPVPRNPEAVTQALLKRCKQLEQVIGLPKHMGVDVMPPNSANSINELVKDSADIAPVFLSILNKAKQITGGTIWAGKDNEFLIKTEESLTRKVTKLQKDFGTDESTVIKNIGDSVRATLIVDSASEMGMAVKKIQTLVESHGGLVDVDNKFVKKNTIPPEMAYVGVHIAARIKSDSGKHVNTEIQVHLRSVNDGSLSSPKEESHRVYSKVRESGGNDDEKKKGNSAMSLIFASALGA